MKRASYGQLSTRHLGVEAACTLGLEVNILTPEFGPRLYLTGILTELELEADQRMEEQVCIGESCSRCLHSCPPDAVRQWGLDKAGCATEAQEFGFMTITNFFSKFFEKNPEEQKTAMRSRDLRVLAGTAARGRLLRRLPALPRGVPGRQRLPRAPRRHPEADPREDARESRQGRGVQAGAQSGAELPGLSEWNIRWVGEKGYQGIVARQLQEFKHLQKEKAKQ